MKHSRLFSTLLCAVAGLTSISASHGITIATTPLAGSREVSTRSGDSEVEVSLKADFEADADNFKVIYHNGFDSLEEASEWDVSEGSSWKLISGSTYKGVPAFSAINPESKYTLYHAYANSGTTAVVSSPSMVIPEDAAVRFYAVFNPVWIIFGNLQLYICEDTEDAVPVKIWDAFLTSQDAGTDDAKWTRYAVSLDDYVGKKVFFAFAYALTDGDDVMIDDFEVVAAGDSDSVELLAGESIAFKDISTGNPESWSWEFPGAETTTSTQSHPTVTYSEPGVYDVTLTVKKGEVSDTVTKKGYVKVNGQAPTAVIGTPKEAYYSPEAGLVVPLDFELTFTDNSTGMPSEWEWTLPGTDLKSAGTQDVTVKYTEPGMYDVDLTVSNDFGASSTYVYGVKAGGESLIWNISAAENEDLDVIGLSWYGWYGGTNWLGMSAYAESFHAPARKSEISAVNVYFASATVVTPDQYTTVSISLPNADGAPGEELARVSMPTAELVDASETYNDPTVFKFETPVAIDSDFFVTISGFPNGYDETTNKEDRVIVYSLRRKEGGNTVWHLLQDMDDEGNLSGDGEWYEQTDDPCSLAIAPVLKFVEEGTSVDVEEDESDMEAEYWTIDGIKVDSNSLTPGVYIRKSGRSTTKVIKR